VRCRNSLPETWGAQFCFEEEVTIPPNAIHKEEHSGNAVARCSHSAAVSQDVRDHPVDTDDGVLLELVVAPVECSDGDSSCWCAFIEDDCPHWDYWPDEPGDTASWTHLKGRHRCRAGSESDTFRSTVQRKPKEELLIE
jgi:hypothetical protein